MRTIETYPPGAVTPQSLRADSQDEVSLADLWSVMRRRWLWLLIGALAGVIVAIAYLAFAVPVYEARATIQIGKVYEVGQIEEPSARAAQLMDQYGPEADPDSPTDAPYLKQASEVPGKNFLKLVGVGYSPENARDFLNQVVAKLMQQQEEVYAAVLEPTQLRLTAIDERIEGLAGQLVQLDKLSARLQETRPTEASFAAMEVSRFYLELNMLERERMALRRYIVSPYSRPSKVLERVVLTDSPAVSMQWTAIPAGIVFGLVLGLLAIFFRESLTNKRVTTSEPEVPARRGATLNAWSEKGLPDRAECAGPQ